MTEREKAIREMKLAMKKMKTLCGECNMECKKECPFYEYCIQLNNCDIPAYFKLSNIV